ncbi:acyl-CoA dehydrogenase [Agrobacterium rhizogenes]|uniref:acyl-CoA dehydrogenase family protein n=1 Tax=Rhizobium rhizogenes TaxID=359 RepID=UPI00115CF75F|nr:acyl-CoA dehydrogenase family protein [Rhizobium rhizogenes]NTF52732.1 acyl-CoA dehydrogenase [Rhizobium rhizogenes]NTF59328.1 acyl-CoA dehydrogenase [Rhizobium rhizogenes]NTF78913.1 acyl-CoA dehydrogenase [Rhizobium rhizogenes]NTG18248.1 acyl-CoA dehydrogenase [Rhizobium rhizogenes]NTG25081.1 acyl-CoA dehydrogenase [Rhizobium rhizogenes]
MMTSHAQRGQADHLSPFVTDEALSALFEDIAKDSGKRDRERTLPFAQVDQIRAARFGAYRLPRKLGGAGATFRQLFEKIIELSAADSNIAQILRNHFVFVERFARHPKGEQEKFWQSQVANGAIFGLANTERAKAQSGDESVTRLMRNGDGFSLNGTKFYSTGSIFSDFVIVRAKDADDRLVTVVIPAKRTGVTLEDDWDAMGQRLTGTGTSRFLDVRVEASEAVFDREGIAYDLPYASTIPQLFLTAVNAGILKAVLRDAKDLIKRRAKKAFYHAPSEVPSNDPILQKIIGDLAAHVFAAETVVLAAADAQDSIPASHEIIAYEQAAHHASLKAVKAKVLVDNLALQAATSLFDVGGASSTQRDYNFDRHWRNARTIASHNPSHYKSVAVGNFELNDVPLPKKGVF